MNEMIDNKDMNEVMDILERMSDEELAVVLLKEFNAKTKALGQLLMNHDSELDHGHWKAQCDDAKKEVDDIVAKIKKSK